jgi:hypothetical protein
MSFRPLKPRPYGTTEEALARVYAEGGGVKACAFAMGVSPTQAYAYADPQAPDAISFDNARRLTHATAAATLALVELLAADAGAHVVPQAPPEEALAELLAEDATAGGDLWAEALRDFQHGASGGAPVNAPKLAEKLDRVIRLSVAARRALGGFS